jgi:stress response protein YsnF
MPDELHIPIIEEEARITKRVTDIERVTVRVATDEEQVSVRDELRHEQVVVTRIPIGREVAEAPLPRTEGDLTVIPVLEERLVVEKRLFLVEELHLRRTVAIDPVEEAVTVRRTRVEVERTGPEQLEPDQQGDD